jgi:HK97 family phage major capsid protein
MQKLITAAGGTRTDDITEGARPAFLGYPVERTEVMPTADANSQIACLFGNLMQATSFGDRRQVTVDLAKSAVIEGVDVFTTDELAIRGTQRFDINVHDVGTSTVAGPMVGLMSAAS